jgi:hypothetical protein
MALHNHQRALTTECGSVPPTCPRTALNSRQRPRATEHDHCSESGSSRGWGSGQRTRNEKVVGSIPADRSARPQVKAQLSRSFFVPPRCPNTISACHADIGGRILGVGSASGP